jgi:hypothetical protein
MKKEGFAAMLFIKITERRHFHTFPLTNPAPMTQTPGEDSSIFYSVKRTLPILRKLMFLENSLFFSKHRERPPPLLRAQFTESILCVVNKEMHIILFPHYSLPQCPSSICIMIKEEEESLTLHCAYARAV